MINFLELAGFPCNFELGFLTHMILCWKFWNVNFESDKRSDYYNFHEHLEWDPGTGFFFFNLNFITKAEHVNPDTVGLIEVMQLVSIGTSG